MLHMSIQIYFFKELKAGTCVVRTFDLKREHIGALNVNM